MLPSTGILKYIFQNHLCFCTNVTQISSYSRNPTSFRQGGWVVLFDDFS